MYRVVIRTAYTYLPRANYSDAVNAAHNVMKSYVAKGYKCRRLSDYVIRCSKGRVEVDVLIVPDERPFIEDPAV